MPVGRSKLPGGFFGSGKGDGAGFPQSLIEQGTDETPVKCLLFLHGTWFESVGTMRSAGCFDGRLFEGVLAGGEGHEGREKAGA